MIGIEDQTVVINIPVVRVRAFGTSADHAYAMGQGFSWAEYGDGNAFPVSNPLTEYIMSVTNNTGFIGQKVLFRFVAEGERSGDGQNEKQSAVTNMDNAY